MFRKNLHVIFNVISVLTKNCLSADTFFTQQLYFEHTWFTFGVHFCLCVLTEHHGPDCKENNTFLYFRYFRYFRDVEHKVTFHKLFFLYWITLLFLEKGKTCSCNEHYLLGAESIDSIVKWLYNCIAVDERVLRVKLLFGGGGEVILELFSILKTQKILFKNTTEKKHHSHFCVTGPSRPPGAVMSPSQFAAPQWGKAAPENLLGTLILIALTVAKKTTLLNCKDRTKLSINHWLNLWTARANPEQLTST